MHKLESLDNLYAKYKNGVTKKYICFPSSGKVYLPTWMNRVSKVNEMKLFPIRTSADNANCRQRRNKKSYTIVAISRKYILDLVPKKYKI